jgi:Major Facilitator Superfamily.
MDNRFKLNIYLMYGYSFFHNLIFAYVIERLYWASKGMSNEQVVYTEIIYAGIVIFLEVPTGSLADIWSKKILIFLSSIFSVFEFLILIYAKSFWYFALAVFMAGIGKSLSSGTCNALIFESLKRLNSMDIFEKVLGRIGFFDYIAAMFAALIGSIIAYKHSYFTTYWLSLVSVVISVLLTLFLTEPTSESNERNVISYYDCMKGAFNFLKGETSIRFVLLFGIITAAVFTYIDEFWQTYLEAINLPVFLFGVVSATRMLSSSLSGIYAFKLKDKFSYNNIFTIILIFFITSIFTTSYIRSYLGLIPLIISFASFGLVEPLTLGYVHHRTNSCIRATVESFQSLILRVFTIVCGLLFGYFSTHYSIFIGFRTLGIILLIYFIYFSLFRKDKGLK